MDQRFGGVCQGCAALGLSILRACPTAPRVEKHARYPNHMYVCSVTRISKIMRIGVSAYHIIP